MLSVRSSCHRKIKHELVMSLGRLQHLLTHDHMIRASILLVSQQTSLISIVSADDISSRRYCNYRTHLSLIWHLVNRAFGHPAVSEQA